MGNLPGKKFRTERFNVDGMLVERELRLKSDGTFFIKVDEETSCEGATLEEVRASALERLRATMTMEFDPMIEVDYEETPDEDRRWSRSNGAKASIALAAGWISREPVERTTGRGRNHNYAEVRLWVKAPVGKDGAIGPLTQHDRESAGRCYRPERLIPFTPERWSVLKKIEAAIASARDRLAAVLADASGAKLDALDGGSSLLLPPLPEAEPLPKARRSGPRR